jgi:hypothetical protein
MQSGLAGHVLHLRLLSYFKRILNVNAKVANSALQLGMAQKKLHGSHVLGPPVDQCRLRSPQAVRAIGCRIQTN